ncbi:MAG: plasmid replication protein, CyRepA1 family, partial [Waterburya sp.]
KKVMVVSDSKSTIEKIEQVLTDKFITHSEDKSDSKVIWSIHSDNSGSEENQHFINNISDSVKNVDVFLASPSLCTGVDIQGNHFDEVYGFFNAVALTATDCLQALHRYRHPVPLHIWVAPRPSFGYKDTNAQVIRDKKWQISDFNNFALNIDPDTGKNIPILNWAFELYCQIEAQSNRSLNNLRDHLHRLLARMGYQITVVETDTDDEAKAQIKEATKKVNEHHIKQVTVAEKIDRGQYLQLKNKPYLTPEEKFAMERFRLEDSYGQDVDEDLVKRDSRGTLLSQLITLEAVLSPPQGERIDPKTKRRMPIPPKLVMDKDLWELDNLPFLPDRQHFCAQWFIWHSLGITQILERLFAGEEYSKSDPDVIKLAEVVGKYRQEIQAVLGFWIPTKSSPTWILGMLINKLGLKTKSCKRGSSGQQVLHYSLAVEELIFAREVLKYRQQQRILKEERQRQRQSENYLHQIMMATQFKTDYPTEAISTPSGNNNIPYKQQGIDMGESHTPWVIEKMQATLTLLTDLVDLGKDVIRGLFPPTLDLNPIQKVLIRYLNNPIKFVTHSSIET